MGAGLGVLDVAKKKPTAKQAEPQPVGRPSMLTVRCSEDWLEMLKELQEFDRSGSMADLIDRALVSYARELKFPKTFPKR